MGKWWWGGSGRRLPLGGHVMTRDLRQLSEFMLHKGNEGEAEVRKEETGKERNKLRE